MRTVKLLTAYNISTHAPLARCDNPADGTLVTAGDFNSRTSCEVRHIRIFNQRNVLDFNSRTSCEVRLAAIVAILTWVE